MLTSALHTFFLVLSVGLPFLWTKVPALSPYGLQTVGALILAYFIARFFLKKSTRLALVLDATIFISLTLLLVLETGGQHSPVFFLLYLLLFAISLLFEPLQSILLTISLLLVFLTNSPKTAFDTTALINLATLVAITPLAIIFGKKYLEALENQGRIQILKKIISEEEADSLLWITTTANPTLLSIIDAMGNTLIYLNSVRAKISLTQLGEKLRSIHNDLVTLYRSANVLKDSIKQESDEKNSQ